MVLGSALIFCSQQVRGETHTVTTTASGFDPDDGLTSLDEAAVEADSNDQIVFASELAGTIVPANTLVLGETVQLIGSASNPQQITISGGGVRQILRCSGFNEVHHLVFTGGVTTDSAQGGAIYADGIVTIANCTFRNNRTDMTGASAARFGGAIFNSGVLTVRNCLFEQNGFDNAGEICVGGGAIAGSTGFTLTNCTFRENTITRPAGGGIEDTLGSCVHIYFPFTGGTARGRCTITDTSFFDNEGPLFGKGTVSNSGQELLLRNCLFQGNEANEGGGVYADEASSGDSTSPPSTWIYSSLFIANRSDSQGGAVSSRGELTAEFSNFIDNTSDWGGAVYGAASLTFKNCFFRNNSALGGFGGAINNLGSGSTILNSLLIRNRSNGAGAALFVGSGTTLKHSTFLKNTAQGSDPSTIFSEEGTMDHCMVAANSAEGTDPPAFHDIEGLLVSNGYNLVESFSEEEAPQFAPKDDSDIIGVSPSLVTFSNGNVVPAGNSRGIGEGDPSIVSVPLVPTDIFGRTRVQGIIDIGAIEARANFSTMTEWTSFWGVSGANGDDDSDGLPNRAEALTGGVPVSGNDPSPLKPVGVGTVSPPDPVPRGVNPATLVVEFPIDERMTFLRATLQSSIDFETWTDRTTYIPLGSGLGIQRTDPSGTSLMETSKTGFAWKMREAVSLSGSPLFLRLRVLEP